MILWPIVLLICDAVRFYIDFESVSWSYGLFGIRIHRSSDKVIVGFVHTFTKIENGSVALLLTETLKS